MEEHDDQNGAETADSPPLSQASQLGRTRQTGGTPEGRRQDEAGDDAERWASPTDESDPHETPSQPGAADPTLAGKPGQTGHQGTGSQGSSNIAGQQPGSRGKPAATSDDDL